MERYTDRLKHVKQKDVVCTKWNEIHTFAYITILL